MDGPSAKFLFGACRIPATPRVIEAAGHDAGHNRKETRMKYILLIYADEAGFQKASKAETDQIVGAYGAYTAAMRDAGVLVGAGRLQPTASATTVRAPGGNNTVLDGPYAETKEQLGGYYIVDVPNLDAALSWAARCPGAGYGAIEVRPIWVM
jgi:hypothetical protein